MAEKLKVNGTATIIEDAVVNEVSFNDIVSGDQQVGDAVLHDGASLSIDGELTDNSDLKVPTEKAVKTYVDTVDDLKADDDAVVKLSSNQSIADIKTFTGEPVFNEKVEMNKQLEFNGAWGTTQGIIYKRPAVSAGSASFLWRNDTTITYNDPPQYDITMHSWYVPSCIPAGSSIRIYWETLDQLNGDHCRKIYKNGELLVQSVNNGSWLAQQVDTTVNPGDYIRWMINANSTGGYFKYRYARISVAESITLTDWEKATFVLTG